MTRLTVEEVADRWRCTSRAVGDAIRAGHLAATKVAGHWLIEEADVERYESARRNVAPIKRTRPPRRRAS